MEFDASGFKLFTDRFLPQPRIYDEAIDGPPLVRIDFPDFTVKNGESIVIEGVLSGKTPVVCIIHDTPTEENPND